MKQMVPEIGGHGGSWLGGNGQVVRNFWRSPNRENKKDSTLEVLTKVK
jgi:hypothetical protein